jgi:hypothetical protein
MKQAGDADAEDLLEAHTMWARATRCLRSGDLDQAKTLFVSAWLLNDRVFLVFDRVFSVFMTEEPPGSFERMPMLTLRLHILKSHLFLRLGNGKVTVRSLDDALGGATRPIRTEKEARMLRAMFHGSKATKSDKWLPDEFKLWLSDAHPDDRQQFAAHAWLSILVFRDVKLGSYDDAVAYLRAAKQSNARHVYLHGERANADRGTSAIGPQSPPFWRLAHTQFPVADGGTGVDAKRIAMAKARRALDDQGIAAFVDAMRAAGIDQHDDCEVNKMHGMCVKCGAARHAEGSALKKCACERAYCCGEACQDGDWADHQAMCRLAARAN